MRGMGCQYRDCLSQALFSCMSLVVLGAEGVSIAGERVLCFCFRGCISGSSS